MAIKTRKIEVPASEVRPAVREELERLRCWIESAGEPSFLEISLPDGRDVYLFTPESLVACLYQWVSLLRESLQENTIRRTDVPPETTGRSPENVTVELGEFEGIELDDLLFVLDREFLQGLEKVEQAMQDREEARARGDLVPLDRLKAELGLD